MIAQNELCFRFRLVDPIKFAPPDDLAIRATASKLSRARPEVM